MSNKIDKVKSYFQYLFRYRYFWTYLARCELIARNRRSKLGMLWIMMSPLLLTSIMSVVFGVIFKQPLKEYAPYILAGMVAWELISTSTIANGHAFITAEPYIRQFNHPVSIYSLKSAVVTTINFLIGSIGLVIWSMFIHPLNTIMGIITLPTTTLILFFLSWGISTGAAFCNTKYRDYPQLMALVMQTVWYLSPVFFRESMFSGSLLLGKWFNINPITHLLNLLRKPFLYGRMPSPEDYVYALGLVIAIGVWAVWLNDRNRKKVIYYL